MIGVLYTVSSQRCSALCFSKRLFTLPLAMKFYSHLLVIFSLSRIFISSRLQKYHWPFFSLSENQTPDLKFAIHLNPTHSIFLKWEVLSLLQHFAWSRAIIGPIMALGLRFNFFVFACQFFFPKGDVTQDDSQRRFLAQHSVATLFRIAYNTVSTSQRCVALKIVVGNPPA